MGLEYGLTANREVPTDVQTSGLSQLSEIQSQIKSLTLVGRVTDIILNKDYPEIEKYGGFSAIGSIFFTIQGYTSGGTNVAKPLFPQSTYYPLKDELVLLFKLPDNSIGLNDSQKSYYYLNVINLWNAANHNAFPEEKKEDINEKIKDYKKTNITNTPSIDSSFPPYDEDVDMFKSDLNLNQNTFIEKENIHPLQPFLGDNIYQGRWGNSIRLSSTAKPSGSEALNIWSNSGENGNPITIIRNGQPKEIMSNPWEPISEDINKDLSSIYLTSTQELPIIASSQDYSSYKDAPTSPNSYTKNQVIINSGRLFFNSMDDHILLSSKKTINLNSKKGLNFDTPESFIVNVGDEILLGSKDACESLVLGDTLKDNLDFVLSVLIQLVDTLQYSSLYPGGLPIPDSAISVQAQNCLQALKIVKDGLPNILSDKCKTE